MPMTENHWTWTCELDIPSDTNSGREVVDQLLEQLSKHDWEEHDVFGVHLAVEEALVNAIKHGNQLDASKTVKVTCKVCHDRAWIEIEDEGDGFDPDDVPDPTDEANLEIVMATVLWSITKNRLKESRTKGGKTLVIPLSIVMGSTRKHQSHFQKCKAMYIKRKWESQKLPAILATMIKLNN